MNPEELQMLLMSMDPAQLAELGIIPEQQDALAERMAQAKALRGSAMPEGRQVGGVYVASSPLESLGAMGQRIAGHLQEKDLRGEQGALWDKQKKGRIDWLRAAAGVPQAVPFSFGAEMPDFSGGRLG